MYAAQARGWARATRPARYSLNEQLLLDRLARQIRERKATAMRMARQAQRLTAITCVMAEIAKCNQDMKARVRLDLGLGGPLLGLMDWMTELQGLLYDPDYPIAPGYRA